MRVSMGARGSAGEQFVRFWKTGGFLLAALMAWAATDSGDAHWQSGFAFPYAGVSGDVHAVVPVGDGTYYVGGAFEFAGRERVSNIARWDPASGSWFPLGSGTNSVVKTLVVGPNGRLYAGGAFTEAGGLQATAFAIWDPIAGLWAAPEGHPNQAVDALQILPDGVVALGGAFSAVNGEASRGVGLFDPAGGTWIPVPGLDGTVEVLSLDSNGYLLAGGNMPAMGHIARYDGAWETVGDGAPGPVQTIAMVDGRLTLGGRFSPGPRTPEHLLVWEDGWKPYATGPNAAVDDLLPVPGLGMVAAGSFTKVGSQDARGLAVWQDGAWHPLAHANSRVRTLAPGPQGGIVAAGAFTEVDGKHADGMAVGRIAGPWLPPQTSSPGNGLDGPAFDLVAVDDGVFVGGVFTRVGDLETPSVAFWNARDAAWSPLGEGLNNLVKTLAVSPDGDLYAGGYFTASGQVPLGFLGRWEGTSWHPMGGGVNGAVEDVVVGEDGTVYVGGYFSEAGGVTAHGVAAWDPDTGSWSAVGAGMNAGVDALAIGLDGTLYAGGGFTVADGRAASGIARFVDGRWQPLGFGKNSTVRALTVGADGSLYAGGLFTRAGLVAVDYVARWDPDDELWSPLGLGLDSAVRSLAPGPDGTIIVGGVFSRAGGMEASHVALWDPATRTWSSLGSGTNASVRGAATAADGTVYLGGFFTRSGRTDAAHFGVWQGARSVGTAVVPAEELPQVAVLHPNYPNPFNPQTTIAFTLERPLDISLKVFDILGREVRLLADGPHGVGKHEVRFDAGSLPSGSYLYQLQAGELTLSRTLSLVR